MYQLTSGVKVRRFNYDHASAYISVLLFIPNISDDCQESPTGRRLEAA